ncbi:translation initiation factor IF-2 [Opitutales bacterium]|nr:translation initiation factor IF-2 [Opitutales bacterium]
MSVRIHAIAKQTSKTSKEVIAILEERGYEVKSASSTIDNITAQSIIEEFAVSPQAVEDASKVSPTNIQENEEDKSDSSEDSSLPFVKSKQDLDRERQQREKVEQAEVEEATEDSTPVQSDDPTSGEIEEPAARQEPTTAGNAPVLPRPPVKSAGVPPPVQAKSVSSTVEKLAEPDAGGTVEGNLIIVKPPIVVRDFAGLIGLKPFQLISELMETGIFASMNQTIDEEVASKVAKSKGFDLEVRHRGEKAEPQVKKVKKQVDENDEKFLEPRPPVVCILGHVDHGKTTLLDTLRKTNIVDGEAGGITQHVGAYQVDRNDHKITFLDTPGHAAFSKIRERGANLTDVSVLVVAADDGFMPQTDEALKFAQRSQSSLLVAINKTDVKGADIDKVKTQMQDRSIAAEDWGGEIVTVPVSALKGDNIDELLDMILLQAELMELKANPKAKVEASVVEARVEVGRGPTATVIVQKGTLKIGDSFSCGSVYCKVKAMIDDKGNQLKSAPPSTPVNVLGWSGVPDAGALCVGCKNERDARRVAEENEVLEKKIQAMPEDVTPEEGKAEEEGGAAALDALFAAISKSKSTIYKLILKADVRGSVEALKDALELIKSDKIVLEVLQSDVGLITKNDVKMAQTSQADILGFNVKMENGVMGEAKHLGVRVFQNSIIYEIIDLVKDNMADLLEPELVEKKTGRAEVRQVFKVSKGRAVAGCMVMEGNITRNKGARLVRGGKVIAEGKIDTLRRFKDDVTDVKAGFECGMRLDSFEKYEEGDEIQTFEVEKIRPTL